MSGGSYNYLYMRTSMGEIGSPEDYSGMADEPFMAAFPDIQARVRKLAEAREALAKEHDALREVLHAVEWRVSGDYGDESFTQAINEWRAKNGG